MGKAIYHTRDRIMNRAKLRAVIRKLKPEEKSEIFISAMRWSIDPAHEGSTSLWKIVDGSGVFVQELEYLGSDGSKPVIDFYKIQNMHLAWKVHIWALMHLGELGYYRWCHEEDIHVYSDTQEFWLDEILYIGVCEEIIPLEA